MSQHEVLKLKESSTWFASWRRVCMV